MIRRQHHGPEPLVLWGARVQLRTLVDADFDFDNADARKASIDNVIWWMQQSGADGLRLVSLHGEGGPDQGG